MSNIDEEGATGFRSLLQGDGEARIVLESTENLRIAVYDNLAENHREVILANPRKTRIIAEARIKSDKLDARILADLVRADLLAERHRGDSHRSAMVWEVLYGGGAQAIV